MQLNHWQKQTGQVCLHNAIHAAVEESQRRTCWTTFLSHLIMADRTSQMTWKVWQAGREGSFLWLYCTIAVQRAPSVWVWIRCVVVCRRIRSLNAADVSWFIFEFLLSLIGCRVWIYFTVALLQGLLWVWRLTRWSFTCLPDQTWTAVSLDCNQVSSALGKVNQVSVLFG